MDVSRPGQGNLQQDDLLVPHETEWARLGSNQRPPACKAGALPLSYAPGTPAVRRAGGRRVGSAYRTLARIHRCAASGRSWY
jgi:hypothetical protein